MENYTQKDVEQWHEPLTNSYSQEWTPKVKNMRTLKKYLFLLMAIFFIAATTFLFFVSVERTVTINGEEITEEAVELGNFPIEEAAPVKAVPELKPAPTPFSKYTPLTEKDKGVVAYVRRFEATAIAEQEKYGIPASIKLAQGIIESGYGTSRLAANSNNHFGIKCFSRKCKKGHCINYSDDSHKDFFRVYDSAWESWRAHSKFLTKGRYKPCFNETTYKGWAKCLKKQGYATLATYAEKLVSIIERYGLWEFDNFN